jgi:CBS domain-containing protein
MTVSQVMEKEVQSVRMRTKGNVIASLLIGGLGAVPVVGNGRKLAGIVSEHDLLATIDDRHHLDAVSAKDIMTSNPPIQSGLKRRWERWSMCCAQAISFVFPSWMPRIN